MLPFGWIYIRVNDYSIFELEYILINNPQKSDIFTKVNGSKINSKFNVKFIEINNKMYPSYLSYERPKRFNRARAVLDSLRLNKKTNPEDHYFSKQEILFTEIITQESEINKYLVSKNWNDNLFLPRVYNEQFWDNYNILLESKEQQKLILDLEKKISLKKQFEQQ